MRKLLILIGGSTLLLIAAVVAWALAPKMAPDATFTSLTGERVTVSGSRGKVLLLSFWSTTCAVCVREMPELVETYRALAPRGLEMVAVAMSHDRPDHVLYFSQTRNLPFKVALDVDGSRAEAFKVEATPTLVLVDRQGRIAAHIVGAPDFAGLRALIADKMAAAS